MREPPPGILCAPLETDILEWHFCIRGSTETPYEGGHFWGRLRFPPEFPMKPPSIYMMTPSGRFETNKRPPFGPSQMLLFRSDHYSFLLAGVPSFSLMPGFTIDGDPEAGRALWLDYLALINHRQYDDNIHVPKYYR